MLKLNFFLRNANSIEKPIYLFTRYNQKEQRFSIGQKINPAQWNSKSQKVRITQLNKEEATAINERLNTLEADIYKTYQDAKKANELLTATELNELINTYLKKGLMYEQQAEALTKEHSLISFIDEFISLSASTKRDATIKTYKTTLTHIKEFANATGYRIGFNSITIEFYDKFLSYLLSKKGLNNNSAGKYIATLKTFLNEANERGIEVSQDYRKKKFKTTREEAETIYLDQKELERIINLELSSKPRLDRVRDLFIIGTQTGLRFSDLSRLTMDNINRAENTIQIRTVKTDNPVIIPMAPIVWQIIKKYEGTIPRSLTNQKMNSYLKEIGELAGLNEEIMTRQKRGANTIHLKTKKFNMISTHTARRSFATNAFLAGVPTLSIMKITGHRTEQAFMKYIKVTAEENAKTLQLHPFFNAPLQAVR